MVVWLVLVGILLASIGVSAVFTAYICMLWYANSRVQVQPSAPAATATAPAAEASEGAKGLSAAELESLPRIMDGGAAIDTECAVCLDDIEMGQSARILPECRHVFHRSCADAWLCDHAVCPLCRAVPRPSS